MCCAAIPLRFFLSFALVVGSVRSNKCPGTDDPMTDHQISLQEDVPFTLTSPNYPDIYNNHADCTWYIYGDPVVDAASTIVINIVELDTENFYDNLRVGVGLNITENTTRSLMSGRQAPKRLIFSDENYIWVNFISDRGYAKRGFSLELIFTSSNVTCQTNQFTCQSGQTCLEQNLVCNGFSNCWDDMDEKDCEFCGSSVIHLRQWDDNITIKTPNFPEDYPNMLDCIWNVITYPPNSNIKISFVDFQTELYFDNFTVWYGDNSEDIMIIEFGGEYPPDKLVVPGGNSAWIKFQSRGWDTYSGITVTLELQHSEEPTCETYQFMCASGFGCLADHVVCDGTALCLDASDEDECDICGIDSINLQRGDSYNLTTPLYPRTYPDYLDCRWIVTAADNGYIIMHNVAFDTEHYYDIISVGSGYEVEQNSTRHSMSGKSVPTKLSVEGAFMWVRFISDRRYGDKGVFMTFEWSPIPGNCQEDEFQCSSAIACLEPQMKCDGTRNCLDGSDETDCEICGESEINLLRGQTLNISSPLFPLYYPNALDCIWIITAYENGSVEIEFGFFQVERAQDFLSVGEGDEVTDSSLILRLSGTEVEVPKSIIAEGANMWLTFITGTSWNDAGFFANIKGDWNEPSCVAGEFSCPFGNALFCLYDDSKCDGRAICPDQADEKNCGQCGARNIFIESADFKNLTSAYYPANYPTDLLCSWIIASVEGYRILVDVLYFDLERGYDFLIVGNGDESSDTASTIGRLTGNIKLRRLVSSDDVMWFKFVSDRTGTRRGFDIHLSEKNVIDICGSQDINCGNDVCVSADARCNGFNDCLNWADELQCESIDCPGSYLCDPSNDLTEPRTCVPLDTVCDGETDCPIGDDEIMCDKKRCPPGCFCKYVTSTSDDSVDDLKEPPKLQVNCENGWTEATIQNIARTTHILSLSGSDYSSLAPGMFKGMNSLKTLSLAGNNISEIRTRTYDGLNNLTWLDLSRNNISTLESLTFEELSILDGLFMWEVPLEAIRSHAFDGLKVLKTLVLVRNDDELDGIQVQSYAFSDLKALETLYVDDHHLCCHFDNFEQCITLEPQPPLFMCGSLMQNSILRIAMWILGISALLGNCLVVIWRLFEKPKSHIQQVQSSLICNLAVSDFLMGVYMVMLAGADVYFGDRYFEYSDSWRSGTMCKLAGFFCLLSGEASVFFITVISVDRFVSLEFPFSGFRLRPKTARITAVVTWSVAFVVSVVPVIFAGPDSDFYDLSDVCIGLPLITRPSSYNILENEIGNPLSEQSFALPVPNDSKPAWYFSIAIFLGLNLVCFLVIFLCYCKIFFTVQSSRKSVKRSSTLDEEIKMAMRMAAIVGTDFLCWMPVIVMGILSQTGAAVIPLEMYTWSVVFILPINSSLNPYLYTIASLVSSKKDLAAGSSSGKKKEASNVTHSISLSGKI